MACERNLQGRKHEPYFLDVSDIYVGEKGWRPMPYIPVGAIVGAIHMQNTISRHRCEEEEEDKKKEEGPKSKQDVTPMYFRKKPVVIEAYQTEKELDIFTLEGVMHAAPGDWIITGVNGEQYPCKPDIFEKTYEPVG